uniref:Uncharacterized protein n=1 Tax=Oryza punctata TaxID=4537 RepID=A0A0E0M6P9_ORYPU
MGRLPVDETPVVLDDGLFFGPLAPISNIVATPPAPARIPVRRGRNLRCHRAGRRRWRGGRCEPSWGSTHRD